MEFFPFTGDGVDRANFLTDTTPDTFSGDGKG